jgi:hypothetical protein
MISGMSEREKLFGGSPQTAGILSANSLPTMFGGMYEPFTKNLQEVYKLNTVLSV